MVTLIAVIAAVFWIWVIVSAARRGWRFFTRPPLNDPNNPPDIGAFAPPTERDRPASEAAPRQRQERPTGRA